MAFGCLCLYNATGSDAALAVENGADAVWVSNHGGRQLDTVPASVRTLHCRTLSYTVVHSSLSWLRKRNQIFLLWAGLFFSLALLLMCCLYMPCLRFALINIPFWQETNFKKVSYCVREVAKLAIL